MHINPRRTTTVEKISCCSFKRSQNTSMHTKRSHRQPPDSPAKNPKPTPKRQLSTRTVARPTCNPICTRTATRRLNRQTPGSVMSASAVAKSIYNRGGLSAEQQNPLYRCKGLFSADITLHHFGAYEALVRQDACGRVC